MMMMMMEMMMRMLMMMMLMRMLLMMMMMMILFSHAPMLHEKAYGLAARAKLGHCASLSAVVVLPVTTH